MNSYTIIVYSTPTNKEPFSEWRMRLDPTTRAILNMRLNRIRLGNLGDAKIIKGGGGIWEIRVNYGPGYRIYFGQHNKEIVVLLSGGDKGSQERDITKAKKYWLDYKERS